MRRQCFLVEYLLDGWHPTTLMICTLEDMETDLVSIAKESEIPQTNLRFRWVWTQDEFYEIRDSGIQVFEKPGGDISWVG